MSIDNALFGRIQLQHLAVTNLIQWSDHLSVDHPGIDAQHKAIFDLGTRVYEHWRGGGGIDVLRPAVDKLASLLETHFAYEERLLAEIGYAGLNEHAAEHRGMLDELDAIRGRFRTVSAGKEFPGSSLLAPGWSIMRFMLGFTVGHVMSSDMGYCQDLAASQYVVQGTA